MPTKRPDGRWQTSYVGSDGKKRYLYGKTLREVNALKTEIEKEKEMGVFVAGPGQPFGQFLQTWLAHRKSSLRIKTFGRYQDQIRLHAIPTLGDVELRKLTPQHLVSLYSELLELSSPATVAQLHAILHGALDAAVKWHLISSNPADGVTPPKPVHSEMKWLTAEQVRTLFDGLEDDPLRAIYVLAVATGMRQGEILGLRWQDIDWDAPAIRVMVKLVRAPEGFVLEEPKTKKSRRRIVLPEIVVAELKAHRVREAERLLAIGIGLSDDRLVFTDKYGEPIYGAHLTERHFKPLLARLDLPTLRFHDLRHTAATLLLEQGVHVKVVSEMLGHASVNITLDRYSHVIPTIQEEAARKMNSVLTGA